MPLSVKHVKTSDKADGQDSSLLQPSDWNADHSFKVEAKRLVGNSAASEGAAQSIALSDDFKLEDSLLSLTEEGQIIFADNLIDTTTVTWAKTATEIKANVPDDAITLAKLENGTQGDVLYYGASGAPTRLPAGSAGMVLKTGTAAIVGPPAVAATNLAWGFSGAPHAVYTDQKPFSTTGGTFTTGAWRDRVINNKVYDTYNFVTLASNIFTLGIGTWVIEWSCPAFDTLRHQTRLYNNTNSAHPTVYGTSEYSNHTGPTQSRSTGVAQVVTTVATGFKVQHRCEENGYFGIDSNFTNTAPDPPSVEVYTIVKIWRVA